MSDAHKKISNPGYVRHTVAGLDDLFSRAANPATEENDSLRTVDIQASFTSTDNKQPAETAAEAPEESGTESSLQTETINAVDFLDFFYAADESAQTGSASAEAQPGAPLETILDASSIIADQYEQEPLVPPVASLPANPPPSRPSTATTAGVHAIVSKLDEVNTQLQSANFRIGYLESEITKSKQKLKLLPDLEAQAVKADHIEKENKELRKRLAVLEINARKLPSLEREKQELQEQLEDLTYRKSNPWWKFWSYFTGPAPRPAKHLEDQQYQRRHYY